MSVRDWKKTPVLPPLPGEEALYRAYWPKKEILEETWTPPRVARASE